MLLPISFFNYRNFFGWVFFGIMIGFILMTIINFQNLLSDQLSNRLPEKNFLTSGIFDNFTIPTLIDISQLIPLNETIVVSDHAPLSQYFSKHDMKIPRGSTSEKSLFEYMSKNNYKYLVVYGGASAEEALKGLFSSEGLKKLNDHYKEIATYVTNSTSIHVYQRKI